MNAKPFALWSVLALVWTAGCVPTSSSVRPPYAVGGKQYDEAQIQALAAARCGSAGQALPEHAFTTDGCSIWPDRSWLGCCVEHDMAYWCGGTESRREQADRALRSCVVEDRHAIAGRIMYIGVRAFAHPFWPFPWRWGYGHDWPFRYGAE